MQSAIPNEQIEAPFLIIFPGIEGVLSLLESFAKNVKAHVYGVEYPALNSNFLLQDLAEKIFEVSQSIKL